MSTLSDQIKEARKAAELTQEKMARLLGVSLSSYCRYEQGVSDPPMKRLSEIAVITGKPLAFFFEKAAA